MNIRENILNNIRKNMEEGMYSDALDLIESLDDKDKNREEISNYIAIICIELQEFEIAEAYLKDIIERKPDNKDYKYNYAYLCIKIGRYSEARQILEKYKQDVNMIESINELLEIITEEEQKKQVLMIAYYYPPLSGSGVFRSLKFSQYLDEMGWRPTVIGAAKPPKGWNFSDETLVKQIPKNLLVHRIEDRINDKDYFSQDEVMNVINFYIRDIFRYDKEAVGIINDVIDNKNYSDLLQAPCSQLTWAIDTIKYIENKMDITKFDVIYTTSGPASSHLVGLYFKNKYNIPWVADFRDLWIGNPYANNSVDDRWHTRFVKHLEKTITIRADKIINISEECMKEQIDIYGYNYEDGEVITNGYDENDFNELEYKLDKNTKFTITYSGLLYSKERSIEPILKSIRYLIDSNSISQNEIILKVVGNITQEAIMLISKYKMDKNVEVKNYTKYKESNQVCVDSDMLLCFIGDEDKFKGVYTGKIFNYLRSGVPVLALAPLGGAVDRLLKETNQGKVYISDDINGISEYISEIYFKWKQNKKKEYFINEKIVKYERKNLTKKLVEIFNEIVDYEYKEIGENVYEELYSEDKIHSSYMKSYKESIYYNVWLESMKYMALLDRNTKIIDIGCGVGQFAGMLFDSGFYQYRGLDFSNKAIEIAKKSQSSHAEKFKVGDAFIDKIFEQEYDVVIMFEILEHLAGDLKLLDRVKKGKKVILSVPNFTDPNHVRYFSDINKVIQRYGETITILSTSEKIIQGDMKIFIVAGIKK